jgi:hypothetical protein
MRIQVFVVSIVFFVLFSCGKTTRQEPIDRFSLVNRHNIRIGEVDPLASLTVGNGNFAFTTDITGLQTFFSDYEEGVSLGTMSNWGWHTMPDTENYNIAETYLYHEIEGRQVPYEHQLNTSTRDLGAVSYFRKNPHPPVSADL